MGSEARKPLRQRAHYVAASPVVQRGARNHIDAHLAASACAAAFNFPLWKAAAIGQSGFRSSYDVVGSSERRLMDVMRAKMRSFLQAVGPPYRGMFAVIFGMTWARALIFGGSDAMRRSLEKSGAPDSVAMAGPPLVLSSIVQIVNMPIVRASVSMQDFRRMDDPNFRNTISTLKYLRREKGFFGLWHGLPAGLAKSVPKYIVSVVVKDVCEERLPPARNEQEFLVRASIKSIIAGLAGALLTNPADVVRNEMFKTDHGFFETVRTLSRENGPRWMGRGLYRNLIAVSMPITLTIFLSDSFIRLKTTRQQSTFETQ